MTFLQPFILLGLPLVLVPIIIHLLNRLRHRPRPWAAMRFLLSATRTSTSHTKLRQFLILLYGVLAVAMLLLFLARPLAGGWLGWAVASAPREYEEPSHLILIGSATRAPQEVATAASLADLSLRRPTDTAADLPA